MEYFCGNIETMEALGKLLGRLAKNGDVGYFLIISNHGTV